MTLARLILNRLAVIFLGAYAIGVLAQTSCHSGNAWLRPLDIMGNLGVLAQAMR